MMKNYRRLQIFRSNDGTWGSELKCGWCGSAFIHLFTQTFLAASVLFVDIRVCFRWNCIKVHALCEVTVSSGSYQKWVEGRERR